MDTLCFLLFVIWIQAIHWKPLEMAASLQKDLTCVLFYFFTLIGMSSENKKNAHF